MKLSDTHLTLIATVARLDSCTHWAIVKDYLETPTNPSHIDYIVDNFQSAKLACLLPGDVRPENYRDQYIVDLGQTLTYPHPKFSWFLFEKFYEDTAPFIREWIFQDGKLEIPLP